MDFDEATLRAIAQVYKEEGNAEYKKKEFRNAASFYTEGIDVKCKDDQLNAILYTNRATSYFCLGYFKEALQDARRAREFQPSYIKAIFRGAKASLELQQYNEAIKWCDNGLAVEKENKALLEIKDKSVDAKMKLEKGYQNNVKKDHEEKVTDSYACHILAHVYFSAGNFEKAIECFKEYLNICKCKGDKIGERKASTNLCNAYYKHGKYKLAIKYGQQSLALSKELGDRPGEGRENGRLGLLYELSNDLEKATEHFTVSMRICQEVGERYGERTACFHLGVLCSKVSEFKKAKEYMEKNILIANELKDRAAEKHAWGSLGNIHTKLSNFKQAIECYHHCLVYSQEVGDRALEGSMYGNIGNACLGRGDFKEAMDYFNQSLAISKEVGDRAAEGRAYGNLGSGWSCFGNYKQAMQYHSKHLDICKELRDRLGEAIANSNLGIVHFNLRNLKEAVDFHKKSLMISQELKDKEGEGRAFGNLGNTYQSLCDFHRAFEYYNQSLEISKEIGGRAHEGTICGNLGCTLLLLGNVKDAIKYYNKHLSICNEVGDKAGEGRAYGNLSNAFRRLGKYSQAMNYHKKHLSIFKKLGDRTEEGMAYRNLGTILQHLGDFVQAKEYFNKQLVISKETGDRGVEEDAYLRLSFVSLCLDELSQAMEFSKRHLTICKATGNISGEGNAHLCQGYCSLALGFGSDAVVSFKSSVCCFNHVRSLLHTKDEWKISLRNEYRMAYTALCNVLLQLKRTEEALLATEKGRAQALVDLLVTTYGFDKHLLGQVSEKETACELLTITASNTVFLAVNLDEEVNVWLIQHGKHVHFIEPNHEAETSESDRGEDLDSLIKKTYKEIGVRSCVRCENRSLDALNCNNEVLQDDTNLLYLSLRKVLRSKRVDDSGNSHVSTPVQTNYLSVLYDIIFAPVINRLCGNELIIVPDGPLFLAPFAALQDPESRYLCESFRIRVIPSLTCLKMILDVPPDHHCKSGALIVGDPWLQEIVNILGQPKLVQLPFARKEAEIIGRIVKTPPLIGSQATKEQVLRRLNSVALIHIAAHGRMGTGEIALAPNTSRKSYIPSEEDFMLTMSDVLRVGLRARLVVLSCCYSGRGEIKDEGVVGIARAFLGAGARSVLVSLWAIEDEATLEFMRVFYQHLADGKTASEALNRATNHMRVSQDFCHIRQWAPFVLIGDDVTLEFFQEGSTF